MSKQTTWNIYLNGVLVKTALYPTEWTKRAVELHMMTIEGYDSRVKCFRGNPYGNTPT